MSEPAYVAPSTRQQRRAYARFLLKSVRTLRNSEEMADFALNLLEEMILGNLPRGQAGPILDAVDARSLQFLGPQKFAAGKKKSAEFIAAIAPELTRPPCAPSSDAVN